MQRMIPQLTVATLAVLSLAAYAEPTGSIEVRVGSIKNDQGQVFVSLFDEADGFPGAAEGAFRTLRSDIQDGRASVTFTELPYGEYAVAAHHDEDGDGKMKTVYGTIPLEGIGVSRDARGVMGPPKFEDAKVVLDDESMSIEVNINY